MALVKKTKRIKVFYGDSGAEEIFKQIDIEAKAFFKAYYDPKHSVHQTMTPECLTELYQRFLSHYEFRASLDWAKEQYYETGSGSSVPQMPGFLLGVTSSETPTFG